MCEVSPVAFWWQLINRPAYTRRNVSQSKLSSPDCWMLELECPKQTDSQAVNWKIKSASLNYSEDPGLCSETFEECLPCSLGSPSVQQSCPVTNWDVIRNVASPKSIKQLHWWVQHFTLIGLTGWSAAWEISSVLFPDSRLVPALSRFTGHARLWAWNCGDGVEVEQETRQLYCFPNSLANKDMHKHYSRG